MADKITDFRRINEPRALRMLEQLGHIQKSAASMKVPQTEVNQMLAPVFAALEKLRGRPLGASNQQVRDADRPKPQMIEATIPVSNEIAHLEGLSTQQLIDRMIACGAVLATRRK